MTRADREDLAEAIFEVENETEHQSPQHPQVPILRAIRNILLDSLGVNERHPTMRYPQVEAVEAIIREKRRPGGSGASPEQLARARARRRQLQVGEGA